MCIDFTLILHSIHRRFLVADIFVPIISTFEIHSRKEILREFFRINVHIKIQLHISLRYRYILHNNNKMDDN